MTEKCGASYCHPHWSTACDPPASGLEKASFVLVKAFNAIPIPRASSSVRVNAFSAVLISCAAAIARAKDLARQGWDEGSTGFKSIFSSGVVIGPPS